MNGIYRITETSTGKIYIGSSCRHIGYRWKRHRYALRKNVHDNRYLQQAWNKYGEAAFRFDVIEACPGLTPAEILVREQYWLDATRCYDKKLGFNIAKTVVAPQSGRPLSAAHKAAIGNGNRGRIPSADTRAKMAEAKKGRPSYWRGKKLSDETKAKISKAVLANENCHRPHRKPWTEAQKLKMSQLKLGNTHKRDWLAKQHEQRT